MARYLRTTLHLGLRTLLLYIIALVCIVGVQPVFAQDPVKFKVQLPNEDEWEADPPYAAPGEKVTITYKGSKFVKDLQLIPLPTFVAIAPSCLEISPNETVSLGSMLLIYPDNEDVDKTVKWESPQFCFVATTQN